MKRMLPDGIWPTMITPFTDTGRIDYASLERLVDWYISQGVDGLFAVCQSSEMFNLTLEEKVGLASATVAAAAGRVPVICSGHTSDLLADQAEELCAMAETGVEAVVLITNLLAGKEDAGDEEFLRSLQFLTSALPSDMPLGFYECPYPYKRLISDAALQYSADSGRFTFLKDTSCDSGLMKRRLQLLSGSGFKLYNANSATLSRSLADGGSGYSGVMANFHPSLYKELVVRQLADPGSGDALQNLLGPLSAIEDSWYPLSAKHHLQSLGVIESAYTRKLGTAELGENHLRILEQMRNLLSDYSRTMV